MRVALVTPVIPQPRAGFYRSVERIVQAEVEGLRRRGHEVEVFASFWNGGEPEETFHGAPVHRLGDAVHRLGRAGRIGDLDYATFTTAARKALLRRRADFDVVHSQSRIYGTRSLTAAGLPVTIHFHHRNTIDRPLDLLKIPFENAANGASLRAASAVTASSAAGADAVSRAWGIERSRVHVLYPGVDLPPPRPRTPRPGEFRLLFVGTLIPRKRVDVLVDALALLPGHVRLTIVGTGPSESALRARIGATRLQDRVEIVPSLGEQALSSAYSEADALVLPSAEEGFGMVLAEAMAHALPVIASDIPAIREVVDEAGILAPVGDAKAIAQAVTQLAADEVAALSLAQAARERAAERFSWDAHVQAAIGLWSDLLDPPAGGDLPKLRPPARPAWR